MSSIERRPPLGPPAPDGPVEQVLLRGVDAALMAALVIVPLAMGGRSAIGQLALAGAALGSAACWCLRGCVTSRQVWSWSWAEPVVLAALGLVAIQIVPLPPNLIRWISPHLYERLPLWSPDGDPASRLGVWSTLSLTPTSTRSSLIVLASYGMLFLVALERLRQIEDVERVLRWVAVAGSAMAAFALLQHVLGNEKYFWVYEFPFPSSIDRVTGSFINRNHFAHFVVLSLGPLVWWIQSRLIGPGDCAHHASGRDGNRFALRAGRFDAGVGALTALFALAAFAVLLSLSRGGAAVMFLAAAICLLVLYRGAVIDGRTVLFLLGTGALIAACLGIYGYRVVSARLEDLQSLSRMDEGFLRRGVWQADLACIADYPVAGTGAGSHGPAHAMYLPDNDRIQHKEFVHAENGYLEIGFEGGGAAWVILAAMMALCAASCWGMLRRKLPVRVLLCLAAVTASLAASALHSLVDFVWYVPGCTVVVLLLAACALRLAHLHAGRREAAPGSLVRRGAWAAALAGVACAGCAMIGGTLAAVRAEPSWHRFIVAARHLPELDPPARCQTLDAMARDLAEVLRWQPDHARAHAKLAEIQLRLFEQSQNNAGAISARQLRQTVLASAAQLPTSEARRQWVARAFPGQHGYLLAALEHSRRAAALCPLQAEAYLAMESVGFLDDRQPVAAEALVRQALNVRPYDGTVLFEAGQETMLAGDVEGALGLWKRSFVCGSYHQQRLFDLLAGHAPAEFFFQTFPMDLAAIKRLEACYRALCQPDQARALLRPRIDAAVRRAGEASPSEARRAWLDAADAHDQLGHTEPCLDCLRNAVECDRANYETRLRLGKALLETQQLVEAKQHLTWCRQRKPDDARARSLLDVLLTRELYTAERPQTVRK